MNAIAQPSAPAAGPQLDNRRVLAALVDLLIIAAGSFVLGFLIGMLGGGFGGSMNLIFVGWALYYYFAFESGDGQTPGKKLLNLRVVRADGGATSMREIAVRTILRVVDGLFVYLVGLVTMLVTGQRRQRLGDLAAGTIVVDASEAPVATAAAAPAAAAMPVAPETPESVQAPEPESAEAPELEPEPYVPAYEADSVPPEPSLASSPVDIGAPLSGVPAPEQPATPEVTDFGPFSEPEQPKPQPEVERESVQDAPPFDSPLYEPPAPEPVAEAAQAASPESAYEPPPYEPEPVAPSFEPPAYEPQPVAPSFEPAAEAPVGAEPQAAEPVAEESQLEAHPAPELAYEPPSYEAPAYETPSNEPAPEADLSPEPAYEAPAEEPQEEAIPEVVSEEEPQEEQITVRPMDAPVSGMDLLMAEDEADSSDGEPPQSA